MGAFAPPPWIIVTCRGCPIVLKQKLFVQIQKSNHNTSQLFKMARSGNLKTKTSVFEIHLFQIQTIPLENVWTILIVNIMLNILKLYSCFSRGFL